MLAFLLYVLLFAFGLGSPDNPALNPEEIFSQIQEHISQVLPPQGDPENSYGGGNGGGNETAQNESDDLPEQDEQEQNDDDNPEPESQNEDENTSELAENPDTTQVSAYNTSSGIVIESVAAVAVENAPPLVSCTDNPDCDQPAPQDEDEPTPTPTPIILQVIEPCPPLPDYPRFSQGFHPAAPQLICPVN